MERKIHSISWREVKNNKFKKPLTPAMFSDEKYYDFYKVQRMGDKEKTTFEVEYDRDYGLGFLQNKVCEPLEELGEKQILDLMKEALKRTKHKDSA